MAPAASFLERDAKTIGHRFGLAGAIAPEPISFHGWRCRIGRGSKVLREERQQVSLDAFIESAGMIAIEFLIAVRNSKLRHSVMQVLVR